MSVLRPASPAGTPGPGATVAPAWLQWAALWTVYLVWGSTYLAIRVMVETVPPLLGAGARFFLAGLVLVGVLAARRGLASVRPARSELVACLAVGSLLTVANAVVTVAEVEVPSALAALLVASMPLWVILIRRTSGERVPRRSVGAVGVGFVGVALLLQPGEQSAGASLLGLAACVFAAGMWASGSFAASRAGLPEDPLLSTGWQLILGGGVCLTAGVVAGEAGRLEPSGFSGESVLAFAYLVTFGSLLAYTAYAWLLQNAPLSKVATYAYVNPVVAIVLGWLILGEVITGLTLLGAAIIVASVALVVRTESRH